MKAECIMKTKLTISGEYVLESEFIRVEVGMKNHFEMKANETYRVTIEKL
jgi:hypothetical protein